MLLSTDKLISDQFRLRLIGFPPLTVLPVTVFPFSLDESLGECAGEVRGLLDCGLKPLKILLRGRKGGKRGGREGGTGEPTPSPEPSEGGLDA